LHVSYGHVPFGFVGCFKEQFDRGFDFRFSFDFGVVDKGTAGLGTGGERTGGGVAEACAVTGYGGGARWGEREATMGGVGRKGERKTRNKGSAGMFGLVAGFCDGFVHSIVDVLPQPLGPTMTVSGLKNSIRCSVSEANDRTPRMFMHRSELILVCIFFLKLEEMAERVEMGC